MGKKRFQEEHEVVISAGRIWPENLRGRYGLATDMAPMLMLTKRRRVSYESGSGTIDMTRFHSTGDKVRSTRGDFWWRPKSGGAIVHPGA